MADIFSLVFDFMIDVLGVAVRFLRSIFLGEGTTLFDFIFASIIIGVAVIGLVNFVSSPRIEKSTLHERRRNDD